MEYFHIHKEEFVADVTFSRPPANALSSAVLKELSSVLDELEADDQVRVVLLHGEGRFFSAGADIKEFTSVKSSDEATALSQNGQQVLERIERFPKPVIAAIHGAALGGGLELAMSCHIRIVSENAKLGLPELQLGIIPGFAGTQRLPRYVGRDDVDERADYRNRSGAVGLGKQGGSGRAIAGGSKETGAKNCAKKPNFDSRYLAAFKFF
jgi:enoyl-CoA hydratase